MRGVRRDGMEQIKRPREEARDRRGRGQGLDDEVQKLTDQYIKKVDELLAEKEKDIRQV